MAKTKGIVIGCLVFPLILIVAFVIGFYAFAKDVSSTKKISSDSWLMINPTGMLSDYSEVRNANIFDYRQTSVEDICVKIRAAATDSRIRGMVIRPKMLEISYVGISEIAAAITEFKKSGKPVYAQGDMIFQKDYLLMSMANKVYMEPSASAEISIEGVNAQITFYKELFDKIGVKVHVLQSGAYKGAGEPYSQTSFTPGTLANYKRALGTRYDLLIRDIAARRKLSPEAVKDILEKRDDYFISSAQARKYGLVDSLLSRDDFEHSFGISEKKSVSIADYDAKQSIVPSGDRVAIVYLSGNITPGYTPSMGTEASISADKVEKIIRDIRADKTVKAVVVRINSGGGSALESELIYQKLKSLQKTYPVVVSMGGVAASGGYYISSASNYIIADEYTITGSIGVIMMIPDGEGLGRKIGVRNQNISFGKYAGAFDLLNKPDPEFLSSLQRNSTSVYAEFKSRVADNRKYTDAEIEAIAQGQIWSAADAKANRLIDEIGSLHIAVAKAASLAKITDYQTVNFPEPISLWDAIRKSGSWGRALSSMKKINILTPEQIQEYIDRSIITNEWLYMMPFKMD